MKLHLHDFCITCETRTAVSRAITWRKRDGWRSVGPYMKLHLHDFCITCGKRETAVNQYMKLHRHDL